LQINHWFGVFFARFRCNFLQLWTLWRINNLESIIAIARLVHSVGIISLGEFTLQISIGSIRCLVNFLSNELSLVLSFWSNGFRNRCTCIRTRNFFLEQSIHSIFSGIEISYMCNPAIRWIKYIFKSSWPESISLRPLTIEIIALDFVYNCY
jgi:hypothetical protein